MKQVRVTSNVLPPTSGLEKLKEVRVTSDVPPSGMGKLKSQVNVTFWFWLMYLPFPQKNWILSDSQLFQSFPTKVAQNDSKWPILPNSQLFQYFPTKVAQNDSEWPISPDL